MKNQWQIIDDRGEGFKNVVFRGDDSADVYVWLKKNSALDAPGYKVLDIHSMTTWEEGAYIREFEEQMRKADVATGHRCLSEDRVRIMIREEFSEIVDSAREKVELPKALDAETMADVMIAIIDKMIDEHEYDEH